MARDRIQDFWSDWLDGLIFFAVFLHKIPEGSTGSSVIVATD